MYAPLGGSGSGFDDRISAAANAPPVSVSRTRHPPPGRARTRTTRPATMKTPVPETGGRAGMPNLRRRKDYAKATTAPGLLDRDRRTDAVVYGVTHQGAARRHALVGVRMAHRMTAASSDRVGHRRE